MSESYVRNVIEAALLAAGTPLPVAELTRLFEDSARPSAQQVRAALAALAAEYSGRGIELKETASGFRIQVRREVAGGICRPWAAAAGAGNPPPVAGARGALLAGTAGDPGADRLPPADHARRDRSRARRRRQPQTHQDRDRAQLGACRRTPRRSRPPGTAGHDARVPRLFRLAEPR